jgi:hypothetical protein
MKHRSLNKTHGTINSKLSKGKKNGRNNSIIQEETMHDMSQAFSEIFIENEQLKQMVHQLRMKNAEHRSENTKLKKDNQQFE